MRMLIVASGNLLAVRRAISESTKASNWPRRIARNSISHLYLDLATSELFRIATYRGIQ
jgi:hypothetical protein